MDIPVVAVSSSGGEVEELSVGGEGRIVGVSDLGALGQLETFSSPFVEEPEFYCSDGAAVWDSSPLDEEVSIGGPDCEVGWVSPAECQLANDFSVGICEPDFAISAAVADEDELLSVGMPAGLAVKGGAAQDQFRSPPFGRKEVDISQEIEEEELSVGG